MVKYALKIFLFQMTELRGRHGCIEFQIQFCGEASERQVLFEIKTELVSAEEYILLSFWCDMLVHINVCAFSCAITCIILALPM